MLGLKQDRMYLNIKEGKILYKDTCYDFIQGYLKGIEVRDRDFRGETVKYWYVNIESQTGELYSLALSYYSGVAKSLFNSLASAPEFTKEIKIQTYQSGEFTKVVTYLAGEKLSWKYTDLPAVNEVKVGDRIVKDESKRMEFIVNLVTEINTKI